MARNPFRVAEKIGNAVGYLILGVLVAAAVSTIGVLAARDFGWWALLIIPGIPVVFLAAGLIAGLTYAIGHRWRTAKYRWDQKHREDGMVGR